jgi:hypothetical protein
MSKLNLQENDVFLVVAEKGLKKAGARARVLRR